MSTSQKVLTVDNAEMHFDNQKTFAAVAQEIKRGLGPKRVLTEIMIDGRSIDLAEEETLSDSLLSTLGQVAFKTRDVVELFKESLQLAPKICDALLMDCEDIESFFAANEMKTAQERISELTSLLEWLLQLISGMQSIGGQKLDEMFFGGRSVSESVHQMQYLLGKLHLHLAAQQWTEFRDVLKGDFKAEVVTWKKLFVDAASHWNPQPLSRES